jgi:hypothetical protein
MVFVFLTFLLTTAVYGILLWLACRRVSRYLQGNAGGSCPSAGRKVTAGNSPPVTLSWTRITQTCSRLPRSLIAARPPDAGRGRVKTKSPATPQSELGGKLWPK